MTRMAGFWAGKRVIVTGGTGFLGSAVVRGLDARGVTGSQLFVPRRPAFDLREHASCARMYREAFGGAPADVVIHVAGTVGGIGATSARPGDFFFDNASMALALIEEFRRAGLIDHGARFCMVGTAAAYPEHAQIPLREESLWHGMPSEAGASYGLAKLMGWEMLEAYRRQHGLKSSYLVPINLYGPHDHVDPQNAHVVASLVRRFVEAERARSPEVVCWGTGSPTRDFLYVDDGAEGVLLAAEKLTEPIPINLGTGRETPIRELAEGIARAVGYQGRVVWDTTKPDGAPRRALDISRARTVLGWYPKVSLEDGLARTVAWYRDEHTTGPGRTGSRVMA